MKRSEMLTLIKHTILNSQGADPEGGPEPLWPNEDYLAFVILEEIENAGMRPPVAKLHTSGQFPGDDFEFEIDCWEEDYYG